MALQPQEKGQGNAWKWWLVVVLFLATVLTYLDRQTISLCGSMIAKDFKLSNEQFGQLLAAFRWCYAFTHLAAGVLADRVAIRMVYALAVAVWSAAGAAAALVRGPSQLLITRGLLGLGEAFNWPCATRVVANLFPPEDRGLGSGIFNGGGAVGSLIAPLIITPLAIRFGWRWAFFTIGVIGFFWIALWMFSTRKGTDASAAVDIQSPKVERDQLARGSFALFARPAFWMLFIVALAVAPCWYFLNEWTPKYMHDQRAMGYLAAGLVTIPIFVAADLGNILSGAAIKLLTMRGWSLRQARGTTLTVATLLTLPVALITRVESVAVAIGLLAAAALGITSLLANFTACEQDLSFANVGIVAGVLGMSANVFAAVVNPRIGRYIDRTGHYTLIFIVLAILPAISLAAILIFDRLVHGRTSSQ